MEINFVKMNATGNDFIIIDNRAEIVEASNRELWHNLCQLKTGIGADGVLLLEKSLSYDFKMRYINADGGEVEMCGNGARAITAFAHEVLAQKKTNYQFETMNGVYECSIDQDHGYRLHMAELYDVEKINLSTLEVDCQNRMYMNTGVPHCVFEVKNIEMYPVFEIGKKVRYDLLFPKGTNANFFEVIAQKHLRVRTYERGVENETLSCGTGVTATALAAAKIYGWKKEILLETLGGQLAVIFSDDFKSVYLCGMVKKVFMGMIQV